MVQNVSTSHIDSDGILCLETDSDSTLFCVHLFKRDLDRWMEQIERSRIRRAHFV